MSVRDRVKQHGIAVMREYHSEEGIDPGTDQMLTTLRDMAAYTLPAGENKDEQANLLMVLLRTACQIGRHKA